MTSFALTVGHCCRLHVVSVSDISVIRSCWSINFVVSVLNLIMPICHQSPHLLIAVLLTSILLQIPNSLPDNMAMYTRWPRIHNWVTSMHLIERCSESFYNTSWKLSRDYSCGAHALGAHVEFWPWEPECVDVVGLVCWLFGRWMCIFLYFSFVAIVNCIYL